MHLDFHVSGIPKAQPRVKAFVRGGHAGVYTPDSAESWKQAVRQEAVANARLRLDLVTNLKLGFKSYNFLSVTSNLNMKFLESR